MFLKNVERDPPIVADSGVVHEGEPDQSDDTDESDTEAAEAPAPKKKQKPKSRSLDSEDELETKCNSEIWTDEEALYDPYEETAVVNSTPPEGYKFQPKPDKLDATNWIGAKVYWYVDVTNSKKPGWIISKIKCGPRDFKEAKRGITMSLLSEKRFDPNTPKHLIGRNSWASVAFAIANYGEHWYLLRSEDEDDAEENESEANEVQSSDSSSEESGDSSSN
jgi:hypothetical protein